MNYDVSPTAIIKLELRKQSYDYLLYYLLPPSQGGRGESLFFTA